MKNFTILSLIFLFLSFNLFSQHTDLKRFHPLSGKVALNFEGGGTYAQTDFSDDEISYLGQLSLDYFFPTTSIGAWGLRGYGYYGELKGSGNYSNISTLPTIPGYYTEIAALGGGLNLYFKCLRFLLSVCLCWCRLYLLRSKR